MKLTVDSLNIKKLLKMYNRDYYSDVGAVILANHYDEIDLDMEFNPDAISSECTEYGEDASYSFDDLINDYEYIYPIDEWCKHEEEFDKDEYIEVLVEHLRDKTVVLTVPNGNYIVFTS